MRLTGMRAAAIVLVLTLARLASADDFAWPHRVRGLYTGAGAYMLGDAGVGGPAITADYAIGRKRWMFGGEAQLQWLPVSGSVVRAGGVIRWLARSFRPDGSGAIELYFDVDPGVSVIEKARDVIVRPDLRVGWGWQIGDTGRWRVRLAIRVIVAPHTATDAPEPMLACKGTCPRSSPGFPFDDGYEALLGVAW